jgi:hypothetical protein
MNILKMNFLIRVFKGKKEQVESKALTRVNHVPYEHLTYLMGKVERVLEYSTS